jgi:hypothetical protein
MMTEETKSKLYGGKNTETSGADKNPTWENNHVLITNAVAKLIRDNERWPTKTEICTACGLSRATVYKHLAQMELADQMGEAMDELKFMSGKVLARLCEFAMDGDIRAMRLAFELMGALKKGK